MRVEVQEEEQDSCGHASRWPRKVHEHTVVMGEKLSMKYSQVNEETPRRAARKGYDVDFKQQKLTISTKHDPSMPKQCAMQLISPTKASLGPRLALTPPNNGPITLAIPQVAPISPPYFPRLEAPKI
jgi:hypothetical protein